MNVGSLFSGIGGFDLGLERAGFRTAWFCEQDEFCQHVLAQHWPGVPCYPDITQLRGSDVEPVDVLCGGFPCQDLSYAGKGAGLDGARSGLWSEYARLIGELRPRYVLVENVSALLARGLGVVLSDLAALGYDAEWDCIPASAVGAPHQRDRVWIVAYPGAGDANCSPADALAAGSSPRSPVGERGSRAGADDHPNANGGGRGGSPEPDGGARRVEGRAGQGQHRDDADGLHLALADADRQGPQGHRGSSRRAGEITTPPRRAAGGAVVADADQERRGGRPRGLGPAGRQEPADGGSGRGVGDPDGAPQDAHSAAGGSREATGESGWWLVEPDVGRVAHGVPARVDRLRSLGNALVPQIAEWIGRQVMAYEESA